MEKHFELWLDESGRFQDEKKNKERKLRPSLVGGILLEKDKVSEIDFTTLIVETKTHAMELAEGEKATYILPVLEKIRDDYGARQVFFENLDYEEEKDNRQLYLRIMAEGLMQLMLTLNARYERVVLHVLIAQRQDVSAPVGQRRINEIEYIQALKDCIQKKKNERRIILDADSLLDFEIESAYREKKLQLADFACNVRLTQGCRALRNVKERVKELYKTAYLFTLSEVGAENYIKQCLAQGKISDALMELYTSRGRMERQKILKLIIERMKETNYRLVKSEMKQCTADLIGYAQQEEDYKIGSTLLEKLRKELIPELKRHEQIYETFHFTLLLQLSDMYLRAGDINNAKIVLEECKEAQEELGDNIEEVYSYYQLKEKEAFLFINSFYYQKAAEIMRNVCTCYENILQSVTQHPFLKGRFPVQKSEYYGDALCMQIYALMFLQRKDPSLYEELVKLSDKAMEQYPDREGELERHRQYRSHIELEQGNYEEALLWLLKSKLYSVENVTQESVKELLESIYISEGEMSCCYYLMYYLLIMYKAKRDGNLLADQMYQILIEEKKLLGFVGITKKQSNMYENNLSLEEIKENDSGMVYHPVEIIFWKLAGYLMEEKRYQEAYKLYEKALEIAYFKKTDYTMRITGLGIWAEKMICISKIGKEIRVEYEAFMKEIKDLKKIVYLEETRNFLQEISEIVKETNLNDKKQFLEKMRSISEKICY